MMKITVPPAALEAGCSAYTAAIYKGNGTHAEFREAIRAAFEAMVAAWPMMHVHEWQRPWLGGMSGIDLILPLPQENPDAEA